MKIRTTVLTLSLIYLLTIFPIQGKAQSAASTTVSFVQQIWPLIAPAIPNFYKALRNNRQVYKYQLKFTGNARDLAVKVLNSNSYFEPTFDLSEGSGGANGSFYRFTFGPKAFAS